MTLARTLLRLWSLRRWVAIGVLLAGVAAFGSVATSHSAVYATASTQMLVDSPDSALTNAGVLLDGYIARANVFARLMTSDAALQYIGKASGVDGSLIEANGPIEINGSPAATHAPVAIRNGKDLQGPKMYKLSFVQNPSLPIVDVYASAPTTAQAIALANGAVTGFATFVNQLNPSSLSQSQRVDIRQLGAATGGMVDPTTGKTIAVLVFLVVLGIWCWLVLFVRRLRTNLRAAKVDHADEFSATVPEPDLAHELGARSFAGNLPGVGPMADATSADPSAPPAEQSLSSRVQPDVGSNGRIFVRR